MTVVTDDGDRPADECLVERVFDDILRTRMAGLPILNENLRVEALCFRDWQGVRVGALVTPWSINLMILPAPGAALPPVRSGEARRWTFPSGDYPFHGHEEPALGAYQQCSLFSPVFEFQSHAAAVTAARAALEALMTAPQPRRVSRRGILAGA